MAPAPIKFKQKDNNVNKLFKLGAAILVAGSALASQASAQNLAGWPLTRQECSDCHMAYSPLMLPMRSWIAIMNDLPNHFGEDASLDKATTDAIATYLVKYAADSNGRSSPYLSSVNQNTTPMRITELPWFQREHGTRTRANAANKPEIGSISNCIGCHR